MALVLLDNSTRSQILKDTQLMAFYQNSDSLQLMACEDDSGIFFAIML